MREKRSHMHGMHFFWRSFPLRKAVTSMFWLTRRGVFLKKTVPWTVEGMAWDTCHSWWMLAGSAWKGTWLPGREGPVPGTGPLTLCRRAVAHGGSTLFVPHLSPVFPSLSFAHCWRETYGSSKLVLRALEFSFVSMKLGAIFKRKKLVKLWACILDLLTLNSFSNDVRYFLPTGWRLSSGRSSL